MAMMGTTDGTPHVGARCRVPVGDVMGSDVGAGLRPAREVAVRPWPNCACRGRFPHRPGEKYGDTILISVRTIDEWCPRISAEIGNVGAGFHARPLGRT